MKQFSIIHIGCCGAFCGTCREFQNQKCLGCKIGYSSGEREIAKAKCKIKICCMAEIGDHGTCADCSHFDQCETIQSFHSRDGYKYSKYRQAIDLIRKEGYPAFLNTASRWRNAYGSYKPTP